MTWMHRGHLTLDWQNQQNKTPRTSQQFVFAPGCLRTEVVNLQIWAILKKL